MRMRVCPLADTYIVKVHSISLNIFLHMTFDQVVKNVYILILYQKNE